MNRTAAALAFALAGVLALGACTSDEVRTARSPGVDESPSSSPSPSAMASSELASSPPSPDPSPSPSPDPPSPDPSPVPSPSPSPEPAPAPATPTTSEPVAPEEPSTALAAQCDAYLVWLAEGDLGPLAQTLSDGQDAARDAVATLRRDDLDTGQALEAVADLQEAIRPRCAERFAADLQPAPDDATALRTLFDAVVAGDRGAAAPIATDDVLAVFEPWSPLDPDAPDGPSFTVDGSTGSGVLAPTVTVFCEAEGGVVVRCSFGE